jgi:hypothetical protein
MSLSASVMTATVVVGSVGGVLERGRIAFVLARILVVVGTAHVLV